MKAVWSFWTKPMKHGSSWSWLSPKYHLLAWILSVETARKHFSELCLFTDDEGAKILIDGLGLDFDHISLDLNQLNDSDPDWWVLGKLYTYKMQNAPFIHIDTDVFLWNSLPERMLNAPLLAQNPEYFILGDSTSYYLPEKIEKLLQNKRNGWLPQEWKWCRSMFLHHQKAVSCGIFGGNSTEFINYYADLAIKLIEYPDNQEALSKLNYKERHVILVEQYLLSACIDYHKYRSESSYCGIDIEYLFPSLGDFYNASKLGYTHLIAKAKQNKLVVERLEKRVKKDYSKYHEKCLQYVRETSLN